MKNWRLTLLIMLLALQGCSWIRSWGKDENEPGAPRELVEFAATLNTRELWTQNVGSGVGREAPQLRPIYSDGTLYTADHKGRLVAVDAQSGRIRWQVKTDLALSGGPGLSGGVLLAGTQDGEIHAFSAANGSPLWSAQVSSEVLAAPVGQDGVVVVRCIDGRVFGLSETDGTRLWIYDHAVPLLTLRGNSRPLVWAGVVYIGYDGGEVVALNLEEGTLIWEQVVAASEGRSELERLADIDGQIVYVAADLLAASYKNRLASLAADSGRLLWFKDIASATGVTVERTNLAISDKDDNVWLLDRRNGSTIWKQDQLANRRLTRPSIQGSFVVVGDFEGYLHWIHMDTGQFAARSKVGGNGFVSAPLVVGTSVYVQTRDGKLAAFSAGNPL